MNFNTQSSPIAYFSDNGGKADLKLISVKIICPVGNNLERTRSYKSDNSFAYWITYCIPCGKGMYNLSSGELSKYKNTTKVFLKMVNCSTCPPGGICNSAIASFGNYWGYADQKGSVTFIPCPIKYCCATHGTPCKSYDTCEKNRAGKLCGVCKDGFSLDLFSMRCISNAECTLLSRVIYLFGHVILAIIYVFGIMYINELGVFFKRCLTTNSDGPVARENSFAIPLLPNSTGISENDIGDNNYENNVEIIYDLAYKPLNKTDEKGVKSKMMISGFIKIGFFFYQVESLLRVNTPVKSQYKYNFWTIRSLISSMYNIKMNAESNGLMFCPFIKLTAIGKATLKVSFIVTMFVILFILYWSHYILLSCKYWYFSHRKTGEDVIQRLDDTVPTYCKLPFNIRIKCCTIRLSLLGYMTISIFLFSCINCVPLGQSVNLYIQGNIECYTYWQWILIGFVIIWMLPYCFVLHCGSKLLSTCKVSPNELLLILLFPPASLFYYSRSRIHGVIQMSKVDGMLAKHLLMNLYQPFRRKPSNNEYIMWESMLIFRKLTLVCVSTFIIHPIGKLYALLGLLIIYSLNHLRVQPYADKRLNMIESCSIALLCLLATINLFWAHIYLTNDINFPHFYVIGEVFLLFEMLVLVFPIIIIILLVLFKLLKKIVSIYKTLISKQD